MEYKNDAKILFFLEKFIQESFNQLNIDLEFYEIYQIIYYLPSYFWILNDKDKNKFYDFIIFYFSETWENLLEDFIINFKKLWRI